MQRAFKQSELPKAQTQNFLVFGINIFWQIAHLTWYVIIFYCKGSMHNLNWHLLFIMQIIIFLDGLLKVSI